MKLTQKEINNLICMIEHTRTDLSYGEGGTFNFTNKKNENDFDKKEARKVELAINTLKMIILNNK